MRSKDTRQAESDWLDGDEMPFEPARIAAPPPPQSESERRRRRLISGAIALAVLVLPAFFSSIYLYGFAADVYEADTVLSLRSSNASGGGAGGGLLGFLPGLNSLGRAGDESYAFVANVRSREALGKLDEALGLRRKFSDPAIDWWQRLPDDADFEAFYNYYTNHVSVYYDEISGQIILQTRAFDADLAFQIATKIAEMGESLVNQFNQRADLDLLTIARTEVSAAEERMKAADTAMTKFRIENNMLDPMAATTMIGGIIGELLATAARLQADIRAESQLSGGRDTPQTDSLKNKLKAVELQIQAEQARLTGSNDALAPVIETYQHLMIAQEMTRAAYTASLAALQTALADARRQKLYIVSIVAPTRPEEARLPLRGRGVLFVFLGSLAVLLVGRLTVSAIRDHVG